MALGGPNLAHVAPALAATAVYQKGCLAPNGLVHKFIMITHTHLRARSHIWALNYQKAGPGPVCLGHTVATSGSLGPRARAGPLI